MKYFNEAEVRNLITAVETQDNWDTEEMEQLIQMAVKESEEEFNPADYDDPDRMYDDMLKVFAVDEIPDSKFWLIEYAGADRFETLLNAETWAEAIRQGQAEFDALSDHDKARRDSVEVWLAPRYMDEDTPDTMIIPNDDEAIVVSTIL